MDLIDIFLHLDKYLTQFVATYGGWVYGLLFLVVFAETGLVVTPFLPGDSLLFAAGALAAAGGLNVWAVIALLEQRRRSRRRRQLRRRQVRGPARVQRDQSLERAPTAC